MSALAILLSSQVKAEVFRLLFGSHERAFYLRELERTSGYAFSAIRKEILKLVHLGIVTESRDGNRTYYRANVNHPLYPELRVLVLKTSGLIEELRERLNDPQIQIAFVFGSIAAGNETAISDVDLMIIGDVSLRQIANRLSGLSENLGREINPHVLSAKEFLKRKRNADHFLTTVLDSPRLYVIGNDHELGRVAG